MDLKFNLTEGNFYNITAKSSIPTFGNVQPALRFNKAFPCYDARFHGVSDPSNYIAYEFQLPEKFGVVTIYQFQLLSALSVS